MDSLKGVKNKGIEMNLVETYKTVRESIVAIAIKPNPGQAEPVMPTIIGTGFVVGEGLIATTIMLFAKLSDWRDYRAFQKATGLLPLCFFTFYPIMECVSLRWKSLECSL